MTPLLAAAVIGYLLGSIPFGLMLSRLGGHGDIRRIGSGNIGATNVLRTGNKKLAALTLLLDIGKGAAAVAIARQWGQPPALVAALAAVFGHVFPVWLAFRGGKGVATALGVVAVLAWPIALAGLLIWLALAAVFRFASLAALIAAVAAASIAAAIEPAPVAATVAVIALLVILRHHANIRRLIAGSETPISFKKG